MNYKSLAQFVRVLLTFMTYTLEPVDWAAFEAEKSHEETSASPQAYINDHILYRIGACVRLYYRQWRIQGVFAVSGHPPFPYN